MKEISMKPIAIEELRKTVEDYYERKDDPFDIQNHILLIDYDDLQFIDDFCKYYLEKHSKEVMENFYSGFRKRTLNKNNKEIKSE